MSEAMFLKFVGPMATLSQGKVRFEKNKIYQVNDQDKAFDMIETGRFQQVRDPRTKKEEEPVRRGGVRINRGEPAPKIPVANQPGDPVQPERGDLSLKDLQEGGATAEVRELSSPEDEHPRLPVEPFTSKKSAMEWASTNLGLELDKNRSVTEMNRKISEAYSAKYQVEAPEDLDDTKEENTKVEAVVVA